VTTRMRDPIHFMEGVREVRDARQRGSCGLFKNRIEGLSQHAGLDAVLT
jgi:hypothetical protein